MLKVFYQKKELQSHLSFSLVNIRFVYHDLERSVRDNISCDMIRNE